MTLPQEPLPDSSPGEGDASLTTPDFEQALVTAEQSLHALKERYTQVQQDEQRHAQLQAQKAAIKQQLQHTRSPDLTAELSRIQAQLDELAVSLESQLFSWGSLREPFWQIVRFGGLGIIIGWSLAFVVLRNPTPTPRVPTPTEQSP